MLLLNKKIFLYFFFFFTAQTFPQIIKEVSVNGNNLFSTQNIIEWSQLKPGTKLKDNTLDSAKESILKNLTMRGYFSAGADLSKIQTSKDTASVNIIINVRTGSPALIRSVKVASSDTADLSYQGLFSFIEGQVFNKSQIEENINNWLSSVENKGYPFARAVITSVNIVQEPDGEDYADILILIDKGSQSRINKVSISGNESTKDYVIIRELRLNRNQIYSQQQVEEFPARLNRLRFFEPVQVPEFFLNKENEGVLVINVKEKQTNNFDGIIGYIPPANELQTGYLTGLVNVSMRNLFGTGRAAAIRWQQYDRHSQELELRYLEPWIFSYPFNISGGLFQRKQDTTYIQRKLDGAVEFLATEDISAGVSVSTENVIPALSDNPRFTVFNSNSLTTGLNLKIDTRDDPYAPLSGLLFLNSYSYSRKKIYGPQQFITPGTNTTLNFQRITADFSVFYQIFSRQVIALGLHGRELRGSSFEESDLFRLGGTNTLRGYRENQYLGSRTLWTNLEYRLLLTRRTFAFLFFDSGYYQRKEEISRGIPGIQEYKSGYGAGINLETGIGVLAVSYALAAGDSFSDGKIHFGIVNEF
jgi:outer membrane protein insertion porin family